MPATIESGSSRSWHRFRYGPLQVDQIVSRQRQITNDRLRSLELRPFEAEVGAVGVLRVQRFVLIPPRKFRQVTSIPQLAQAHSFLHQRLHATFELYKVMSEGVDVDAAADWTVTGNKVPTSHRLDLHQRVAPSLRVRITRVGNSIDRNQAAGDQSRGPFVENRDRTGRARPLRCDQSQRASYQFERFISVDQAARLDPPPCSHPVFP